MSLFLVYVCCECCCCSVLHCCFFFFKQKTAYEMRISDWSSDVCSSDLSKIHLNRGDLVEKSKTNIEPLDIAYIDIVKHRSLVNPMIHFYGRVKVGDRKSVV